MTLDSGLQHEVLASGDGATPTAGDKVTVHYRGTLIDGTVFDSSYNRGDSATFPLTGVIAAHGNPRIAIDRSVVLYGLVVHWNCVDPVPICGQD